MAKMKARPKSGSQILLGEKLGALRLKQGITRKQLGRVVNAPEQQIARYEEGAFVPLAMLEKLMKALGEPVQKKWIRRISLLRKREQDSGEESTELSDLYAELFEEYDDE